MLMTWRLWRTLQVRLVRWQEVLERYGSKVNAKMTDVLLCSKKGDEKVTIRDRHGEELKQVNCFKYLGLIVADRGGCEKEVQSRVNASWLKWKEMIMTDKKIPMRLKAKVYTTVVRPVLVLGPKEERSKKTTNNRDEYATKDVGCDTV